MPWILQEQVLAAFVTELGSILLLESSLALALAFDLQASGLVDFLVGFAYGVAAAAVAVEETCSSMLECDYQVGTDIAETGTGPDVEGKTRPDTVRSPVEPMVQAD